MNKNQGIIIVLVIIIIALAALISFSFLTNNDDNVIIYNNTIDGVGTFNTFNVTNFVLDNYSDDIQTNYIGNDSIAQVSTTSSSSVIDVTISEADKVNDSAEGHTIYKNTATIGEYKGDVRYFSILKDNEKDRYIFISTGDYNLTCMMVDSFKMF